MMNAESRPLTERERAACIEDLTRYRLLLADTKREQVFFAECACRACRRERVVGAGPRARGAAASIKQVYMVLVAEVTMEIECRLAGIRALERDLAAEVKP